MHSCRFEAWYDNSCSSSCDRRDRVAERKQFGSATPGSGSAFRPMGRALVPSRRRDCEQNPAARRHNRIGLVKPPVAWTAGQPDCQDSKEGRKAVHNRCVAQGIARCRWGTLDITPHVKRHSGPSNDRALHYRTIDQIQKRCRWLATTSLRRYEKISTSLALSGRPPGAGPRQDSGARSESACEPGASRPQRTRPEACTAQSFTERRRGSPHFQGPHGRGANGRRRSLCQGAAVLWPRGALSSCGKLCECRRPVTESTDFVVSPRLLCMPGSS